jgi:hypothetical protein
MVSWAMMAKPWIGAEEMVAVFVRCEIVSELLSGRGTGDERTPGASWIGIARFYTHDQGGRDCAGE